MHWNQNVDMMSTRLSSNTGSCHLDNSCVLETMTSISSTWKYFRSIEVYGYGVDINIAPFPVLLIRFRLFHYLIRSLVRSREVSKLWDLCLALLWRRNGPDGVSNHQPQRCLLNRPSRRRSKKTPKLRVTGLCTGNSPGTGEFLAQMAGNAENVSIWWRHHGVVDLEVLSDWTPILGIN